MVRETEARTRRAMGTRHFAMNAGLGARSGERKRKESLAAEAQRTQRTQRWEVRRGRYLLLGPLPAGRARLFLLGLPCSLLRALRSWAFLSCAACRSR